MTKPMRSIILLASLLAGVIVLAGCSQQEAAHGEGAHEAAAEFERGPHRGRMLRSGPFAVEITIFETNVPPRFHVYAYDDAKPVAPGEVKLSMSLTRLGGRVDRFSFKPNGSFLAGDGVVVEPHSFDVQVSATYKGKQHSWKYASYEGRTVISDAAAQEGGLQTEKAGPASVLTRLDLLGTVEFAPGARVELRPRFPGRVLGVPVSAGDRVTSGQTLASVESNESLQPYAISSPISGIVLTRNVNPGDIVANEIVFDVGDPARVAVNFRAFGEGVSLVKPGGRVYVETLDGRKLAEGRVQSVSPRLDPVTQSSLARASLPETGVQVQPGAQVLVGVVREERQVPLAVRTEAIQQFRDFEVVFAKVGTTYEVRMLEIGQRSKEWTEVLGGLQPGEEYVARNSYLIKADIEKSGASHDH